MSSYKSRSREPLKTSLASAPMMTRRAYTISAAALVALALALANCGNGGNESATWGFGDGVTVTTTNTPEAMTDTTPTEPTSTGEVSTETAGTTSGLSCADTCIGTCVAEQCCPFTLACNDKCCVDGQFCSFGTCVAPGGTCMDASDCEAGSYCEYTLGEPASASGRGMCMGGVIPPTGKCLPKPPSCVNEAMPQPGFNCIDVCEFVPSGDFEPEVKAHWDGGNIAMTPVVIQLDDDNCDGKIDAHDIPELVFTTSPDLDYTAGGTLVALSLVDGVLVEKWMQKPDIDTIHPGYQLAGGDIDGQPGSEIVACTAEGGVRAFAGNGTPLWDTASTSGCLMPALADLDGDGDVEVVTEGQVVDGATGNTVLGLAPVLGLSWHTPTQIVADVDDDPGLDLVTGAQIVAADGSVIADTKLPGSFPAVADLDHDGAPEIVVAYANSGDDGHHLRVWRHDSAAPSGVEVLRVAIDINGPLSPALCPEGTFGNTGGGGPPTIADFNGDGTPDVGVAGGVGYAVFDGTKLMNPAIADADTLLWSQQTHDCTSAVTGSSVFDFDGDGKAEVVYSDEHYLRIYRGEDGTELFKTCNTTGTLFEYPVIADVDSDDHADIVVVSNFHPYAICPDGETQQRGLRVFGDKEGRWVRTQRVWNQHAFSITNVADDGIIPAKVTPNWGVPGLNNFRQNVQPDGETAAPDLIATLFPDCSDHDKFVVVARVRNIGQAVVPAGVVVAFYSGDPESGGVLLGSLPTTAALYPAEAEDLVLKLAAPPPGLEDYTVPLVVVVDDGMPVHPWRECRTDNNRVSGFPLCVPPG